MDGKIEVYTDGSYDKRTGRAAWAYVLVLANKKIECRNGIIPPEATEGTWQVSGELSAAVHGIKAAARLGFTHIEVRHDLMMVGTVPSKPPGKLLKLKPQSQRYANWVNAARQLVKIEFRHVKGHSGNAWNDLADTLCTHALKFGKLVYERRPL